MSKKRKYDDSYIKWGFMKLVDKDGTERPQCVLCSKVLAEASMKPSKLKAHLASTHPTHQNDSEDMFRSKKARFMAKGTLTRHGFQPSTKPMLEASYEVALRIAKEKKAHTIGETLVKPCAVVMANLVCGPEEAKELKSVPLCNNTIKRRIEDMSNDIVSQVTQELRESRCRFSLQLDESTDVASCSQLLVFVRYLAGFAVKEEILILFSTQSYNQIGGYYEHHEQFYGGKRHRMDKSRITVHGWGPGDDGKAVRFHCPGEKQVP